MRPIQFDQEPPQQTMHTFSDDNRHTLTHTCTCTSTLSSTARPGDTVQPHPVIIETSITVHILYSPPTTTGMHSHIQTHTHASTHTHTYTHTHAQSPFTLTGIAGPDDTTLRHPVTIGAAITVHIFTSNDNRHAQSHTNTQTQTRTCTHTHMHNHPSPPSPASQGPVTLLSNVPLQ